MLKTVFSPGASDEDFRLEVRSFLRSKVPPMLRDLVRDGRHFTKDQLQAWHEILMEKGWLVPNWPKEYGGTGWTPMQRWIYEEEYHTGFCPPVHLFNYKMLGPILIRFGNEDQKRRYLPRLLNSQDWWCQGYSEPESGSDLASLRTRAVRSGNKYVVNGSKIWTSFAHWATRIFCLVRTDTEVKPQQGISFLLIDMKAPGVTVQPIISVDGRHHFNQVFFDNVEVPVSDRVGEENQGWTIAKSLLQFERLNASRYGESLGRLARLKEIAALEKPGGTPLIEQDWFRRRVAEAEIHVLAVQYTVLRSLARLAAGETLGPETSILKLRGSQVFQEMHDLLLQVVGPHGLPYAYEGNESEIESLEPFYGSAMAPQKFFGRGYTIAAGSSEVQHEVLAKQVLGMGRLS